MKELAALTVHRPKAALPFGGNNRFIDFPLTSIMKAGINRVAVLSQYRPASLMDHIGVGEAWNLNGRRRGINIRPPYMAAGGSDWYRGTADAVYKNINYIKDYRPEQVMILSGDHIHNIDLTPILQFHREKEAHLTIVVKEVAAESAHKFGITLIDKDSKVVEYQEKPDKPAGNLASLTIYIFEREALIWHLIKNARLGKTYQLYDEIVPAMVSEGKVFAYVYQGYWNYSRSFSDYFQAHQDLLGEDPVLNINDWGVRTSTIDCPGGDPAPSYFSSSSRVSNSVISPGCQIDGQVENSVLSPGVVVEKGARVKDSVIMHNTRICKGASLQRVICDKDCHIGARGRLGQEGVPRVHKAADITGDLVVIGKGVNMPEGVSIQRGVLVYPEVDLSGQTNQCLEWGTIWGSES